MIIVLFGHINFILKEHRVLLPPAPVVAIDSVVASRVLCSDVGAALLRGGSALPLPNIVLQCVQRSKVLQLSDAEGEDGHCYR